MKKLPPNPQLKEITAYKKKLNWSEVPAIYHMASASIGELDGILTHGFDSAYKRVLNRANWNYQFLQGYSDEDGNLHFKKRPKISLRHVIREQHYELHCFPIINNERVNTVLSNHLFCPFNHWVPETMRMLFRISNLTSFIEFAFRTGDKADRALIMYAANKVDELINILSESFEIVDILGTSILEFCEELGR